MKHISILIISLYLFLPSAVAQQYTLEDLEMKTQLVNDGYIHLPKRMRLQEPGDGTSTVRYFINYRCPFCKASFEYIKVWRETLPAEYEFSYEVLIAEAEGDHIAAMATDYIFVIGLDDERRNRFMQHMYDYMPRTSSGEEVGRLVKEALVDIKVDPNHFVSYMMHKPHQDALRERHREHIKIKALDTPAILVGGELYTHFGLAKADSKLWMRILNGMVSRHIYMERDVEINGDDDAK